jgi:hypothetical protein
VRAPLTGGAGRQRGPVVSGGVRGRVRESEAALQQALIGRPGSTVPVGSVLNSVLNRFKHIQTVPMKFEFLQTLAGSKDTFRTPKI